MSTDDDLEEISANTIQVKKHKMTNLKMFLKRKGKEEERKHKEYYSFSLCITCVRIAR